MSKLHLRRKALTFWTILKYAKNWPDLVNCRLKIGPKTHRVESRDGLVIECDMSLQEQWGEVFEPVVADVYQMRKGKWDIIVDAGANIGSFSCMAAFHHPEARIYSFEPGEQVYRQALHNIALNHLTGIDLRPLPLTKNGGEVEFFLNENRGSSNLYEEGSGVKVKMPSTTLDSIDYRGAKSLFIKMDCEGAEGELIEWVVENLSKLPPKIEIRGEYHHWCPVPMETSLSRLRKAGFRAGIEYVFDEPYIVALIFPE